MVTDEGADLLAAPGAARALGLHRALERRADVLKDGDAQLVRLCLLKVRPQALREGYELRFLSSNAI